jgi:hypothetical protein
MNFTITKWGCQLMDLNTIGVITSEIEDPQSIFEIDIPNINLGIILQKGHFTLNQVHATSYGTSMMKSNPDVLVYNVKSIKSRKVLCVFTITQDRQEELLRFFAKNYDTRVEVSTKTFFPKKREIACY